MSVPSIVKGTYLDVMVEQTPGMADYVRLCGLTTKNFTYQKNSNDIFIPDCDDPEDVPTRRLNITGRQWDLAATGYYNRAQAALIRELIEEGSPRSFRFAVGEPATDVVDAGYWEGPAQLMNLQFGGPAGGEYSTLDLTIASDGVWEWIEA